MIPSTSLPLIYIGTLVNPRPLPVNSVALIELLTSNDPVISVSTFILNPSTFDIDAVADPSAICDKFNPVTPLAGTLYKPPPSPIKDPVKKDALTLLLNAIDPLL